MLKLILKVGLGLRVAPTPYLYHWRVNMQGTLDLNPENIEKVLDELRPYLMADGGNVELVDVEGPVVRLRLQGACGSCPSSAMTLRMGIERKLKEVIPEIAEIEQVF
jgi:Fe-S cluster biogenesis protein NfuA